MSGGGLLRSPRTSVRTQSLFTTARSAYLASAPRAHVARLRLVDPQASSPSRALSVVRGSPDDPAHPPSTMLRSLALLAVVAAGARAAVSPLTPATAAMGSSQTLTWTADPTRARRAASATRADSTIDLDEHGDLASNRQQPGHEGRRRGHLGAQRRDHDIVRACRRFAVRADLADVDAAAAQCHRAHLLLWCV